MSDDNGAETCPRCDRVDCAWFAFSPLERARLPREDREPAKYDAWEDCIAHAVDWRARALAAESRLSSPPAPPATGAVVETVCSRCQRGEACESGLSRRPDPPQDTTRIYCDDGCELFRGPREAATAFLERNHRCPVCAVLIDEPSISVADGSGNWIPTCFDEFMEVSNV